MAPLEGAGQQPGEVATTGSKWDDGSSDDDDTSHKAKRAKKNTDAMDVARASKRPKIDVCD